MGIFYIDKNRNLKHLSLFIIFLFFFFVVDVHTFYLPLPLFSIYIRLYFKLFFRDPSTLHPPPHPPFFPFKFKISFLMSASLTSTKLKLKTYLYLLSVAIILRCFLYFKIPFRFGSSIFHAKGPESGNIEMLRF